VIGSVACVTRRFAWMGALPEGACKCCACAVTGGRCQLVLLVTRKHCWQKTLLHTTGEPGSVVCNVALVTRLVHVMPGAFDDQEALLAEEAATHYW
jgi:hypothetical protein